MVRGGALVALVVVLLGAAALLLVRDQQAPSLSEQTTAVAEGLKCPTCQALSVAESDSPVAKSMRSEVRQQLQEGKSPEQIRSWFVGRYGRQVLLAPPADGPGVLLWVVPPAAFAVGVALLFLLRRGRTREGPEPGAQVSAGSPVSPRRLAVVALVLVAVGVGVTVASWGPGARGQQEAQSAPGSDQGMSARDWVLVAQSLEQQGAYDDAADAYGKALQQRPRDASLRTRLAFVLVRDGHASRAMGLVSELAKRRDQQGLEALLVLGLAQRARSMPEADHTLRTFLRLAPDNPAAPQIRQLVQAAP